MKKPKIKLEKKSNFKKLGDTTLEFIDTGFPTFNKILGGGFAKGTFIEMWGTPGAGKTTLTLQVAAKEVKEGRKVIWFDSEHSLSKFPKEYFAALGLDINDDKFIYVEPTEGSHADDLQQIIDRVREEKISMLVVDSIARLDPPASVERDMEDQEQAALPKFLKRFLNKIIDILNTQGTVLIMINQITADMTKSYATETTPGGHNPKFVSWARIRLHHKEYIDEKGNHASSNTLNEQGAGTMVGIAIKKTRGGRPHLETELRLDWNKGFNTGYDKVQGMIKSGEIVQAGPYFKVGEKSYQGMDKLLKAILGGEK
jgi:RecA/RadA recombinase